MPDRRAHGEMRTPPRITRMRSSYSGTPQKGHLRDMSDTEAVVTTPCQEVPSNSHSSLSHFYRLGDRIGKGASGVVYRALNQLTGETVAIKQIPLENTSKICVDAIYLEIDLLKNLTHPNIVKYHGLFQSHSTLSIILEYCEGGSLCDILRKYGKFPESLVATYMEQVLNGLDYLHSQGAIHRDIKGANILTTKDGQAKLADFGVALRLEGPGGSSGGSTDNGSGDSGHPGDDKSVVGTPNWMAPEIVELNGATTASDIWSLGCTVLELITGKPPYADLDQMAALFAIVDRDHPPIPKGISVGLKDFLMQCFQKNPNLRISAKKLRKHAWIRNVAQKNNTRNMDEAILTVKEWNKMARRTSSTVASLFERKNSVSRRSDSSSHIEDKASSRPRMPRRESGFNHQESLISAQVRTSSGTNSSIGSINGRADRARALAEFAATPFPLVQRSRSNTNLSTIDNQRVPTSQRRHSRAGSTQSQGLHKSKRSQRFNSLDSNDESFDDLEGDLNIDRMRAALSHRLAQQHPGVLKATTPLTHESLSFSSRENQPSSISSGSDVSFFLASRPTSPQVKRSSLPHIIPTPVTTNTNTKSEQEATTTKEEKPGIQQFIEQPDEDDELSGFDELSLEPFAKLQPVCPNRALKLSTANNYNNDEDSEEDPFEALVGDDFDDDTLVGGCGGGSDTQLAGNSDSKNNRVNSMSQSALRDMIANDQAEAARLVGLLETAELSATLIGQTARALAELLAKVPETRKTLVQNRGVIPLVESIEWVQRQYTSKLFEPQAVATATAVANLIKCIITITKEATEEVLDTLASIGGLTILFRLSRHPRAPVDTILRPICTYCEIICHSNAEKRVPQFLACGGLNTICTFVSRSSHDRPLITSAVDILIELTQLQAVKLDVCRYLAKTELIGVLAQWLGSGLGSKAETEEVRARILTVMMTFATSSNTIRKLVGSNRTVISGLLDTYSANPSMSQTLKILRNLSAIESNLDTMQQCGAIPKLVEFMQSARVLRVSHHQPQQMYHHDASSNDSLISINQQQQQETKQGIDVLNQIIPTLFNLCRLSKQRQEEAAKNGLVPILVRVVASSKSSLKPFALPILCDMAHAGRICRFILWKRNVLAVFLDQTADLHWRGNAYEAIASWVQIAQMESTRAVARDAFAKLESHLCEPASMVLLISGLDRRGDNNSFAAVLEAFFKILRCCDTLKGSIPTQTLFVQARRGLRDARPMIAVPWLNIIRLCVERASPDDAEAIAPVLEQLCSHESVLVRNLAKDIVHVIRR